MKKIYWILFFLFAVNSLTGCTSAQIKEYEDIEKASQIAIENANPAEHGLVFGSIGPQRFEDRSFKPGFTSMSVYIRPLEQTSENSTADSKARPWINRAHFDFPSSEKKPDFSSEKMMGEKFAIALKPGMYQIYNAYVHWGESFAGVGARGAPYVSAPFEVKKGQAVYLGRFIAQLVSYKKMDTLFGQVVLPRNVIFTVLNDFESDKSLLLSSLPISKSFEVVNAREQRYICRVRFFRCASDLLESVQTD